MAQFWPKDFKDFYQVLVLIAVPGEKRSAETLCSLGWGTGQTEGGEDQHGEKGIVVAPGHFNEHMGQGEPEDEQRRQKQHIRPGGAALVHGGKSRCQQQGIKPEVREKGRKAHVLSAGGVGSIAGGILIGTQKDLQLLRQKTEIRDLLRAQPDLQRLEHILLGALGSGAGAIPILVQQIRIALVVGAAALHIQTRVQAVAHGVGRLFSKLVKEDPCPTAFR